MTEILNHKDGRILLEPAISGKFSIRVEMTNKSIFCPTDRCETTYGIELVNRILDFKGPAYLCDEIMRDEDSQYVQKHMRYDTLSYLTEDKFAHRRILDFGCGSGASTMILHRMFPDSSVVGVELDPDLLEIAKLRAKHYRACDRVHLLLSPAGDELPENMGSFDFIFLNAVYEHLLPTERVEVLSMLWQRLKPTGVLFINQTPYRWFPVEIHTTSGLPFINYLPDRLALHYAKRLSKRGLHDTSWEELLRKGIRGGSAHEIMSILMRCRGSPRLLEPCNLGMKDRIDMWFAVIGKSKYVGIKKTMLYAAKFIKTVTGLTFLPTLALAIQKGDAD